jgi:hypothetical protein
MATLRQARELITKQLRERVDELVSAVEDDGSDFADVARLADAVGELADGIGAMYSDIELTLMRGLQGDRGSEHEDDDAQQSTEETPGTEQRHREPQQNGSTVEDVTKEELLERAREVNVHGRSSMSKEELAQAVGVEESLTKDELLERARQAGIEGRSSMTKDELRAALRDAGD